MSEESTVQCPQPGGVMREIKSWTKTRTIFFLNQIDGSSGEVIGQEDCLMMNIYSPNLTPETPLPVMVWNKQTKKSFNLRFCIARSGYMVGVLLLEAILPLSMEHPPT